MTREDVLDKLKSEIRLNDHIIGTVAGSGMTAKYTVMGGADLILALSAGRYRLRGRSSFMSYFCYGNSNEMVMDLGVRELLPLLKESPVIFGLNACDPFISLYDYLGEIKKHGFVGVVNFPTVCLIDGQFREALEEEGNSYDKEVEAISLARFLNMFTIAFVRDEDQARKMVAAGADVVCVHFGFTRGGQLGAKKYLSIERARQLSERIFEVCDDLRSDVIKLVYGGPAITPSDMQYIYKHTSCMGYLGGSTFDRIPAEQAITNTTRAFKQSWSLGDVISEGEGRKASGSSDYYIELVKGYVRENYTHPGLLLSDLASAAHISSSYLSTRFKRETGCSFTDFLIDFRMEKAKEILEEEKTSLKELAERVGYDDYAQFSKMFKKHIGMTPSDYIKSNKNTNLLLS